MLRQLQGDLMQGFAGRLDRLTERASRNLYRDRIAGSSEQFAWWDSETRGNWLWGYTLMAFLAGDAGHQARVRQMLAELMATQDEDGYLGIYQPGARFAHGDQENGELWAQGRALLALLSLFEFTGDAAVLRAVRRAVDLTMRHYGEGRPYFQRASPAQDLTGMTHGLCYIDVLDWLHRLTGEPRYRDFSVWLFADFSRLATPFPNDDLVPSNLAQAHLPLHGHAAHTVEHLRALLPGARERPELVDAALLKLRHYATPSGAVVGDESIHGLPNADSGYEYCTLTELLLSLTLLAQERADVSLADWAEVLAFNALQGARMADGSAISYLSCDTRLAASRDRADSYSLLNGRHGRFKFSPTHEDVACCCNPTATRALGHYIARMWLQGARPDQLVAMLYGPSEFHTEVAGVAVRIVQHTAYPFEDQIRFHVEVGRPLHLNLCLRVPGWVAAVRIDGVLQPRSGGFVVLARRWSGVCEFTLGFEQTLRLQAYPDGLQAVLRGPLQYVWPVQARRRNLRAYSETALADFELFTDRALDAHTPLILDPSRPDLGLTLVQHDESEQFDWADPPIGLQLGELRLRPLGSAMLRRAGFVLPQTSETGETRP